MSAKVRRTLWQAAYDSENWYNIYSDVCQHYDNMCQRLKNITLFPFGLITSFLAIYPKKIIRNTEKHL